MKTRPLQSKKHICTLDTDIHQKNAKSFCSMWRMSDSEQSQAVSFAYAHMVPGKSVRRDWISEPDQCKTRSIAAHWIVRSIKGLLKLCVCVCTNRARTGRRAGLGFRTRSIQHGDAARQLLWRVQETHAEQKDSSKWRQSSAHCL